MDFIPEMLSKPIDHVAQGKTKTTSCKTKTKVKTASTLINANVIIAKRKHLIRERVTRYEEYYRAEAVICNEKQKVSEQHMTTYTDIRATCHICKKHGPNTRTPVWSCHD